MKILLINPPIRLDSPPSVFPLGQGYIAKALMNASHDVKVLDINGMRYPKEIVEEHLRNLSFDVAAIGGLITTYSYVEWLIQQIKQIKPGAKIVVGGGLGSSIPEIVLNNLGADAVVIGEGEITIVELINTFGESGTFESIKGIGYKKEGKVIKTPQQNPILDLDVIPFPAWELFPMDVYTKASAGANFFRKKMDMVSSRGCPYNCIYCYHLFGRSKYRYRSALNIVEEIEELIYRYKIKYIEFVDDNFLVNKRRVYEFCDLLRKEKISIKWSTIGRVNNIDDALLRTIKKAGCNYVSYGLESGSQKILDIMNKKVTVEQNKEAVRLTEKVGLYPGINLMIGMVGETRETFEETKKFCLELGIHNNPHITQAYPGTPLYEKAIEMGRIKDEEKYIRSLGDTSQLVVNLTDFSDEELLSMVKEMDIKTRLSKFHEFYYHLKMGGLEGVTCNTINYIKKILGQF